MPDIPNRDELERKLARELGKLNQAQLARLLEAIGDPPDPSKIPPQFWDEVGAELLAVLRPFLQRVYLDQAAVMLASQPIGVDWALINQAAVRWANDYSYGLVRGITTNSQNVLRDVISSSFSAPTTLEQVTSQLSGLFGPVRAEMISITEITRAASEGEIAIARQIMADNPSIEAVPVWQTRNDERVCLVCGPNNGKLQGTTWQQPPPAHPRCRCWVNTQFRVKKHA